MLRVLLTFVGFHDPYHKSAIEGEELKGPILYLLALRPFDRVYLFTGPNTRSVAEATASAIRNTLEATEARIVDIVLDDPISYGQIIAGIRSAFGRIARECPGADYSIATASGTPQMHASWLLLAASGEIPARVLQTRPPQFVTTDRQAVEEIDLSMPATPLRAAKFGELISMMRTEVHADRIEEVRAAPGPSPAELAATELGIVGEHPAFRDALEQAAQLAAHAVPVLLHGETGTGKELVARFIHRLSGRPVEKLEIVNCANLPKDLAESILFGHRKGAFTGAVGDQKGRFELADRGTLFLDEIGEIPLDVQAKLLRVLEDGTVRPLGAAEGRRVDIRLVAATNRELEKMVRQGAFRDDLYYRIAASTLRLPPLRERPEDIPLLAIDGLANINKTLGRPKRLSQACLDRLVRHSWPGNVRELLNVLRTSAILCRSEVIEAADLRIAGDGDASGAGGRTAGTVDSIPEPHEGFDVQAFLDDVRRRLFSRALELANGSPAGAAKLLNVSPQAVSNFVRRTGEG